jgi:hypothetical protein
VEVGEEQAQEGGDEGGVVVGIAVGVGIAVRRGNAVGAGIVRRLGNAVRVVRAVLHQRDDVLQFAVGPGEGLLGAGEGRHVARLVRVSGRLGGGGPAAVVLVGAGFDDGREGPFGDGGVPAQGGRPRGVVVDDAVGARAALRQFACEVPHQVVGGVAAVRRLLQEGDVD